MPKKKSKITAEKCANSLLAVADQMQEEYSEVAEKLRTFVDSEIIPLQEKEDLKLEQKVMEAFEKIKLGIVGRGPLEYFNKRPDKTCYWLGKFCSGNRFDSSHRIEIGDVLYDIPYDGDHYSAPAEVQKCESNLSRGWLTADEFETFKWLIGYAAAFGTRQENHGANHILIDGDGRNTFWDNMDLNND